MLCTNAFIILGMYSRDIQLTAGDIPVHHIWLSDEAGVESSDHSHIDHLMSIFNTFELYNNMILEGVMLFYRLFYRPDTND